jgi:hypothetical protein
MSTRSDAVATPCGRLAVFAPRSCKITLFLVCRRAYKLPGFADIDDRFSLGTAYLPLEPVKVPQLTGVGRSPRFCAAAGGAP